MPWSSESEKTTSQGVRTGWVPTLAAALAMLGAAAILVVQVTVDHGVESVSRTCGSAFDALTDRVGWEVWWARDLDEPDGVARAALIRTDLCPAAINQRITLACALGALGIALALYVRLRVARGGLRHRTDRTSADALARLGRTTTRIGAALSLAGVVAIVVLVADADSTLFLYVDRLVVGVIGLIVLVPTIALVAIGRALMLAEALLDPHDRAEDHVDA